MSSKRRVRPDVTSTKRKDGSVEVTASASTRHVGIITEAELRKAAEIPDDYETVVFRPNSWVQQDKKGPFIAYQAKGTFKPTKTRMVVDELLSRLTSAAPKVKAIKRKVSGRRSVMLEVIVPDLHLGLFSYAAETGAKYNMNVASRMFLDVIQELLERSSNEPVDKIVFPVGNDYLHIDGLGKATTNGTPQDVVTSYHEIVVQGQETLVRAIDLLKERAPVEVLSIPGNHDEALTFHVSQVLAAWYRNDPNVTVDASPKLRKYRRWGTNLIGWTHGRYEKPQELISLISVENPRDWGQTTHREIHLGHEHRLMAMEQSGVRLRWIPSLAAPSAWITRMGYNGTIRAAEAYMWEQKSGYAGHDSVTVSPSGKVM